jgi:hypothetical protein
MSRVKSTFFSTTINPIKIVISTRTDAGEIDEEGGDDN